MSSTGIPGPGTGNVPEEFKVPEELLVVVRGYPVALDCAYHPETHVWAKARPDGRVRLGLDALGAETTGTLAQLALVPAGTTLRCGEPLGTLEAEKFVGPLATPLSGTVLAINDAVVADPGIVERDPFGEGWMVELEVSGTEAEWAALVRGAQAVPAWFESKVEHYRMKGMLAE